MEMSLGERFAYYYSDVTGGEYFVVVHVPLADVVACGGAFPNMTNFGNITLGLSNKLDPGRANALRNAGIRVQITDKDGARRAIEAL